MPNTPFSGVLNSWLSAARIISSDRPRPSAPLRARLVMRRMLAAAA